MAQRLNPNARTFAFNPGASEWAPGSGGAPEQTPQMVIAQRSTQKGIQMQQKPSAQNQVQASQAQGTNEPKKIVRRENLPVPTSNLSRENLAQAQAQPVRRENLPVPKANLTREDLAQVQANSVTQPKILKPEASKQVQPKQVEKVEKKPTQAKPADEPVQQKGWDEEPDIGPQVRMHVAESTGELSQADKQEPLKNEATKAETKNENVQAAQVESDTIPEPTDEELAAELALLEAEEAADTALEKEVEGAAEGVEGLVVSKKKKKKEDAKVHDSREHLNIVFIGHVDAGKSTISGQILLLTNQVDERTMAKYEKEAKEKNRESWYLAYIMDTNEEERAKGKTVEVGRAHFSTANKRFTLLDAPGHKNYVPNMIEGTAQADIGVLVISARKGEFETGFERGGQTQEHAMLAKTLGIQRLVVLINKMDDKSIEKDGVWNKDRYDLIEQKMTPFLKKWGYNVQKDVTFLPCSGFTGANIRDVVAPEKCPWFQGLPFMELLDKLPPLKRTPEGDLRIPIVARYKDMGTVCILGKIESGTIRTGDKLIMMPGKTQLVCLGLIIDDQECDMAVPGENVVIKVKGCEEEDVRGGMVLSHASKPSSTAVEFIGQIWVLDLLEHKPLITAGYAAVLHTHSLSVECMITQLVSELNMKTNQMEPKRPRYLRSGSVGNVKITVEQSIAIETFKDFPQMGRFTLRDEGKTIGIGKTLKLLELK